MTTITTDSTAPLPAPGAGFPPAARLHVPAEYQRMRGVGRTFKLAHFKLVMAGNGRAESRLGLVVGRKFGNAVTRNRIKRLVRELFRHHRHLLESPVDVVVIPYYQAATTEAQLLRAELYAWFAGRRGRR